MTGIKQIKNLVGGRKYEVRWKRRPFSKTTFCMIGTFLGHKADMETLWDLRPEHGTSHMPNVWVVSITECADQSVPHTLKGPE